jgi:hypothetical protein
LSTWLSFADSYHTRAKQAATAAAATATAELASKLQLAESGVGEDELPSSSVGAGAGELPSSSSSGFLQTSAAAGSTLVFKQLTRPGGGAVSKSGLVITLKPIPMTL